MGECLTQQIILQRNCRKKAVNQTRVHNSVWAMALGFIQSTSTGITFQFYVCTYREVPVT